MQGMIQDGRRNEEEASFDFGVRSLFVGWLFCGPGFFVVEFSVTFEGKAAGQASGAHFPLSPDNIFEQK
jgi:hypothetical protein